MADNLAVRTVVIVGAGVAGATAAETLRRAGYDGRIVLVGAEREPPYERPPLSKAYLLGEVTDRQIWLRDAAGLEALQIEARLGEAAATLDLASRRVTLASGNALPFDRLLIATGGLARRLALPGVDLPNVYTLRSLADARALRAAMERAELSGGRVVVVGAGFIGSEVAAACRIRGIPVTMLEMLPVPLGHVLGNQIGAIYAGIHQAHGVDLRLGEGVAALRGAGEVEEVVTASGSRIACALVVVGVGMRPATDWLDGSGLRLEDGIVVDEYCETAAPGVFAAGDAARWPYRLPGADGTVLVRMEHWDNALRQAETAARNALDTHEAYAPVPYFWSDQYDLKLQYVGFAPAWDELVVRGQPGQGPFAAFYLERGIVRAALGVNRMRELVTLKRLVGTQPETAALADDDVDLKRVLGGASRPTA